MGSGALVLVWSHPFAYTRIFYLSHLGHTELRLSDITRPNEDLFDETIAEAAHLNNQCGANKKPRRNTYEKRKNTKGGPLFRNIDVKRDATRGLPRRSPILVLLSTKHP